MMNPKVTVLMPTYNDEKYIHKSIQSVLSQKEVDIQLIIVNDGSTDNTEEIIRSFNSDKIILLNQGNSGQLNALLTAVPHIKGGYVALFHSDDLVTDEYAFRRNVEFIQKTGHDGVYSDYITINENDEVTGRIPVDRNITTRSLKKLLILGGSNFVGDHFFLKREVFMRNVVKNYIVWNMPYWAEFKGNNVSIINVGYIEKPWYKYRVYSENYIRSDIGKFEASSGVLRTVCYLSSFLKARFVGFRWSHRLPVSFTVIDDSLSPEYYRYQVLRFIQRIFSDYSIDVSENPYYMSLLNYYSKDSKKIIEIDELLIKDATLFLGKDARVFYKKLKNQEIHPLYKILLDAMTYGRFKIKYNGPYRLKLKLILKFLNLFDSEGILIS
ncbi:MAG TPA: glycosyltransferase family 2 protein [Pseudothermotoga sp.]